jgi:hypothetical protein
MHYFLKELRKTVPSATIFYVNGNHECIDSDRTEVLTDKGWKMAKYVTVNDIVAQFDMEYGTITYSRPINVIHHSSDHIIEVKSNQGYERVTKNHSLVINKRKIKVQHVLNQSITQLQMRFSGYRQSKDSYDSNLAKCLVWVVCDGCVVMRNGRVHHIQFKISKERKLNRLREILDLNGIKYTYKICKKTGLNKLQPYYIRVYGDYARDISKHLSGVKQFPYWFESVSPSVAMDIVTEIGMTDGSWNGNHIAWTTISTEDAETIQKMCIYNGIGCKIRKDVSNKSGFKNSKLQHHVNMYPYGLSSSRVMFREVPGVFAVTSIQMPKETIITRVDGYVNFTGNCRLEKYLSKNAKELAELDSLKLENLLKLSDFNIKYVNNRYLIRDGILYSHLDKYNANPGASAKAIGLKEAMDCIHGHTHLSSIAKYNRYTFIDGGCLCELQQAYVTGPSHFRQAFTVIYKEGDLRSYQLVNIDNHQFYYGHKLYKPRK